MAQLTIEVPDKLAARLAVFPAEKVAEYAVAALEEYADEGDADDLPEDIFQTHPLPAILTQSLTDDLRAGFADINAGRVTDGETFLAELRQRAVQRHLYR